MKKRLSAGRLSIFLICVISGIITLFPFYWLAISSLKPEAELFSVPPAFIPKVFSTENYVTVWNTSSIPVYFVNSIINTAAVVSLVLIVTTMASYSISRYDFKGKKTFLVSILLAQIMPVTTLIIPLYIFWGFFGQTDSRISLIFTYCSISIPVGIWLLTGFMNGIPRQIDEAARIDGANSTTILFRIIIPLMKPGLMAAGLTVLVYVWQELIFSMTFIRSDSLKMLMAGLYTFVTSKGIRWGPLTAAGVISVVPIVTVFQFFQKALVRGLTAGAVKG